MKSSSTSLFLIFFIVLIALDGPLIAPTIAQVCTLNARHCWKCSDFSRYANGSIYQQNLKSLLSSFSSSSSSTNQSQVQFGFYYSSLGQGADRVNAIALCSGDLGVEDCRSCVSNSSEIILRNCTGTKEAILWSLLSDGCMIRYSPSMIFGTMEKDPSMSAYNERNVSDAAAFRLAMNTLLRNLSDRAASGNSSEKFAAGHAVVPGGDQKVTIYALVQCTPDIGKEDCSNCIESCISDIPSCCDGKIGARVSKPSCNLRYESALFYDSAVDSLVDVSAAFPPTPTTPETPAPPNYQGKKSNTKKHIIIIVVAVAVAIASVIMLFTGICVCLRMKQPKEMVQENDNSENFILEDSLQYEFEVIKSATDDFSDANRLGQGGFGAVYKGTLLNGQNIAVKRLSKNSEQGDREFKNEVILLAQLQHRNLVRLLGFCLKGEERLLIYEYIPNTSLNHFIFDPIGHGNLDWKTRYKIIGGIVRGLLYLHEDSRLRIIHRDLKPSNILLGEDMNPKIADFGMARLFVMDQTQEDTKTIVGTYGYMAPEYAIYGRFSVKSDVFSFGVLVLEIVSGKRRIGSFRNDENDEDLLNYAWRNWRSDNVASIIDPTLTIGSRNEMIRCIHIGLLCVQENVNDRPIMASVVSMLNSDSLTLSVPSKPAYYSHNSDSDMSRSSKSLGYVSRNQVSNITEPYPR